MTERPLLSAIGSANQKPAEHLLVVLVERHAVEIHSRLARHREARRGTTSPPNDTGADMVRLGKIATAFHVQKSHRPRKSKLTSNGWR